MGENSRDLEEELLGKLDFNSITFFILPSLATSLLLGFLTLKSRDNYSANCRELFEDSVDVTQCLEELR